MASRSMLETLVLLRKAPGKDSNDTKYGING